MSRRSVVAALAIGVVALMTVAGLVLAALLAVDGGGVGFGGRIAVLEVEGIIADDEDFLEDLRRFRRDGSVKGYVLAVNSPGGVVAPSQSIYREMRRLRDEDRVPVIASIGATGASGGYYVALAADTILALPGSITGSIGVIVEFPNVRELLDKVGVDVQVVKSSEHKDMGSPFREMSPADRDVLDAMVQDVYAQFVDVVAEERGIPVGEVRRLADGRLLSGRQALEAGLVDGLGNMTDAVALAGRMAGLGDRPRIVLPPSDEFGLLDLLLGRAPAALGRMLGSLETAAGPSLKFIVH